MSSSLTHSGFLIQTPFMSMNILAAASLSFKLYMFQAKRNKPKPPVLPEW